MNIHLHLGLGMELQLPTVSWLWKELLPPLKGKDDLPLGGKDDLPLPWTEPGSKPSSKRDYRL